MTKLEQIEKSVAELSKEELKAFAEWFEELQADMLGPADRSGCARLASSISYCRSQG